MNIFLILLTTLLAILQDGVFAEEQETTSSKKILLNLEIADTPEKMAWGLMGIDSLPENQGMLFCYNTPRIASIWMFNVYIDLSVAFIDGQGVIRELHEARAFPAMLGPQHRLSNVYQLSALSRNDPVVRFFTERSIHSKVPVQYTLEVNKGWFSAHKIKVGDYFEWKPGQNQALIWRE